MKPVTRALARLLPLLLLALSARVPAASPADTPATHVPLAYAARGLPAGDFRLFPSLGLTLRDNDNVFATEAPTEEDLAWVFRPTLRAESLWSRHRLVLEADAESLRYQEQIDEDVTDYRLAIDNRLDLRRGDALRWHARRSRHHEPRGTPDAVPGLHPTPWDDTDLGLAWAHEAGRLTLDAELTRRDIDYQDVPGAGGTIDNDDRDRVEGRARLRLGVGRRDWRWAWAEVARTRTDYRLAVDDSGVNRDERRLDLGLGLRYALSGKTRLEGQLARFASEFDDPALDDFDGTLYRARLAWTPTRRTRLSLDAERQAGGTTLAGASGVLTTALTLAGEHRLRPALVLAARLRLGHERFHGLDRSDDTRRLDLAVRRLINRNLALQADFSRRLRQSTGTAPTDNFTQNILSVGLLLNYD